MKKLILILAVLCLGVASAFAISTPEGALVTIGTSGTFTESSAQSVAAEGGNVTNVNLYVNSSTARWQGFVGNVSGNLRLGRGTNVLYNFGNAELSTVLATTNSGFTWSGLAASTAGALDGGSAWNYASGVDQGADVFTGSATIAGVASVPTANTLNSTGGTFAATGVLDNGSPGAKTTFAFGTPIQSTAKVGFDGSLYQYQLLVPAGTAGTDTYYFYVTLA